MDDAYFDRIFPEWAARISRVHWTPIPVIRRAVELLTEARPAARILDVGSGVGKFCLAGSALSGARFLGIEQRPHFVELSRRLASWYRLPRVTFERGDLNDVDWDVFDGVYLFNPFQEHLTPYERIDGTIVLGKYVQLTHVRSVESRLKELMPGARVVTYHGFGGSIPRSFRLVAREHCYRGPLECWEKTAA